MLSTKNLIFLLFLGLGLSSCITFNYEDHNTIQDEMSPDYSWNDTSSKAILGFNFKSRSLAPLEGIVSIYNLETGETLLTRSSIKKKGVYYTVAFSRLLLPPGVYALVECRASYSSDSRQQTMLSVLDVEDDAPWFVVEEKDKNVFLGTVSFYSESTPTVNKSTEKLDLLIKKHRPELHYEVGRLIYNEVEKRKIAKQYKLSKVNFD